MLNTDFNPFPVLETGRLILYQLTFQDTSGLFRLRGNPIAMRYIGKPVLKDLSEAEALILHYHDHLLAGNGITWAIGLKEQNSQFIGTIGFHRLEKSNYRAEIGYILQPEFWGKGLMKEAIQVVLSYGFDSMALHSVEARINPDNIQSSSVLIKNGFVKEAYFKEAFCLDGDFYDTEVYSLLSTK